MNNKYLLIFLGLLLVLPVVTAELPDFNSAYIKWTMCDQFNLSKWDCDAWWNSPSNPYYTDKSSVDASCFYNKTEIDNMMKNYFNKTESEDKFYNKSETIKVVRTTEINQTNLTGYYNKSEVDEIRKILMVNFSDKFVEEDELDRFEEDNEKSSGVSDSTILLIGGGVIVLIGGFFWWDKKNKSAPDPEAMSRPAQRKLQTRKAMEHDEEIKDLKEKVKELSKPKKPKEEEDASDS